MSEEKIEFTVSKMHLTKMLDHYRDMLLIKYPTRFLTPAFMEILQEDLQKYQMANAKRETNIVWRIPVKVVGDSKTNNIDVDVAENVLLTLTPP